MAFRVDIVAQHRCLEVVVPVQVFARKVLRVDDAIILEIGSLKIYLYMG